MSKSLSALPAPKRASVLAFFIFLNWYVQMRYGASLYNYLKNINTTSTFQANAFVEKLVHGSGKITHVIVFYTYIKTHKLLQVCKKGVRNLFTIKLSACCVLTLLLHIVPASLEQAVSNLFVTSLVALLDLLQGVPSCLIHV